MRACAATRLRQHLCSRAGEYFHQLRDEPVQVNLTSQLRRTNSTLYEFAIAGQQSRHAVLVKSPQQSRTPMQPGRSRWSDRPRLCVQPPLDQKICFEYAALGAIEQHLMRSPDDRFAAVRTLDLLPDGSALIMEKASGRNLRDWLFLASRLSFNWAGRESLSRALRNSGSWLRKFHQLPPLGHTQPRARRRDDFIQSLDEFLSYLASRRQRKFCEHLRHVLIPAAQELLPEELPIGLSHGDYAPWNILAENSGRIRVIDTLGRWRAPIYEDLAKFRYGVQLSPHQVWSLGYAYGSRDLDRFLQEFLEGYFGVEPIPYAPLRLFEYQQILERWAALVHAAEKSTGWRRFVKESRTAVWETLVKSFITKSLPEIHQCAPHHI